MGAAESTQKSVSVQTADGDGDGDGDGSALLLSQRTRLERRYERARLAAAANDDDDEESNDCHFTVNIADIDFDIVSSFVTHLRRTGSVRVFYTSKTRVSVHTLCKVRCSWCEQRTSSFVEVGECHHAFCTTTCMAKAAEPIRKCGNVGGDGDDDDDDVAVADFQGAYICAACENKMSPIHADFDLLRTSSSSSLGAVVSEDADDGDAAATPREVKRPRHAAGADAYADAYADDDDGRLRFIDPSDMVALIAVLPD